MIRRIQARIGLTALVALGAIFTPMGTAKAAAPPESITPPPTPPPGYRFRYHSGSELVGYNVPARTGGAIGTCLLGSFVACGFLAEGAHYGRKTRRLGIPDTARHLRKLNAHADGLRTVAWINAAGITSFGITMGATIAGEGVSCHGTVPDDGTDDYGGNDDYDYGSDYGSGFECEGLFIVGLGGGPIAARGLLIAMPTAYESGRLYGYVMRHDPWREQTMLHERYARGRLWNRRAGIGLGVFFASAAAGATLSFAAFRCPTDACLTATALSGGTLAGGSTLALTYALYAYGRRDGILGRAPHQRRDRLPHHLAPALSLSPTQATLTLKGHF